MILFSEQHNPLLDFRIQDSEFMAEKKYKLNSTDGRIEFAMDFFIGRGFTKEAAAGIVGNLIAESGVNPKSEQYGGGPGRGIAQWSVDQRWQTYLKFANNRKLDPLDLEAQLRFIIHEMPSQMGESAKTIKTMTDSTAAAKLFMDKYERPGKPNWDKRVADTDRALRMVGGKGLVQNDRGPITRADDRAVQPRMQQSVLDQAKSFFDNLIPDTVDNFTDDSLTKAREFFNNLIPGGNKETKPTLNNNELKPL